MHGRPERSAMTITLPGPTVGVVGGGQLGRMLAEAASPLGVDVVVLDPTPDCPAARVAEQIQGAFDDPEAVRELAERADVLTYEIELADASLLREVREETGTPVHPDPSTLAMTADKLIEKEALADAGIPVAQFVGVATERGVEAVVEELGGVMLKAREGGYDGRGNVPVGSVEHAADALEEVGGNAVAERLVPFERELAVMGVRGADGETATFPVTETIHEEEILRASVSPPRADDEVVERAEAVAEEVLDLLDGRGVFGIELFETPGGDVLVNEIAPRPHNSGHWTIEGTETSQFEQHLRAVLGWPLGPTDRVAPTASANLLPAGEESRPAELRGVEAVLDAPDAHLHWYGKREARPLRKMGHLTVTGGPDDDESPPADADLDALADRALALADDLEFAE